MCINEAMRDQFEYHLSAVDDEIHARLSTHPRSEELGTAGEIASAARFIHGDYFLVYFGDILSHINTGAMQKAYEGLGRPAALVGVARKYRTDKGIVGLSETGAVLKIEEKPELEIPNLVGIDIFRSDALEDLAIGEDLHRDVLPRLLHLKKDVLAYVTHDADLDLGSIDAYRRAQAWK